jgi:SAM-dependent methyltransferase
MAKAVDELKRIVRGAARRAVPAVEHVAGIAPPVNAAPPVRPRPVPDGTTESELEAVMSTIRVDDGPEAELAGYMNESYWRFLHTWGLVAGESGRALELGSNPYFTTWLLRHHTDLDLTLANYFGSDEREITQTVGYRDREGASQSFEIRADLFDLETERFPYDDGSFDVVLFCEIIEHLIADPMHALSEIHRVLRPGGLMVITTPNVARLDNVLRLIDGENVFDPYSFCLRQWIGIVIAVAGAAVIAWGDFGVGRSALLGDALALAGAVLVSVYYVIGRRLRLHIDLWWYIFIIYGIAAGALVLAIAVLPGVPLTGFPARDWLVFLALAAGPMMLGHTGVNYALRYVRAYIANLAILGEPVGATLIAWLLPAIAEVPGPQTLVGGALILTGIVVTVMKGKAGAGRRPAPA